MSSATMMALARVASRIWNNANRSPLAVGPKMPTTSVTAMAAIRKPGRVAQPASGMIAHSRYQGCTTGNSSTVAPSATPRPPTGCSRPRSTASSSQVTSTAMMSDADRAGQRQHGGGVVTQTQQNADLAGAQRQQRGRRHPAAHHVGGAQREQPAEPEAAGPSDDRHDRQRQRAQPPPARRTPSRAAPSAGPGPSRRIPAPTVTAVSPATTA